jgi:hypothetical protein
LARRTEKLIDEFDRIVWNLDTVDVIPFFTSGVEGKKASVNKPPMKKSGNGPVTSNHHSL